MLKTDLQYFGGRGASSGISSKGNKYGSQYHTVFESGNMKFVENNKDINEREALMGTMTPGRIYVQVGGNDILRIITFDKRNKRIRTIEKDKRSKEWHTHYGYEHAEYGEQQHEKLTEKDEKILARAIKTWNNKRRA